MNTRLKMAMVIRSLLYSAIVVTFFVAVQLPTPPGGIGMIVLFLLATFCCTLLGPFSYSVMFTQPFIFAGVNLALCLSALAAAILFFLWWFRPAFKPALYISTSAWVIIGGIITFWGWIESI